MWEGCAKNQREQRKGEEAGVGGNSHYRNSHAAQGDYCRCISRAERVKVSVTPSHLRESLRECTSMLAFWPRNRITLFSPSLSFLSFKRERKSDVEFAGVQAKSGVGLLCLHMCCGTRKYRSGFKKYNFRLTNIKHKLFWNLCFCSALFFLYLRFSLWMIHFPKFANYRRWDIFIFNWLEELKNI